MLGDILCKNTDELIERWYDRWKKSDHPHPKISEAALKDHLPKQLNIIGEQLAKTGFSEEPTEMWKVTQRLDPEARVSQDIPIEEVVAEYKILVRVVREWIEEMKVDISFKEYSYFYEAVFELISETARRYSKYQKEMTSKQRRQYLAGLAHQMRNPLMVIHNQLELVEEGVEELGGDAVERIKRNSGRLLFLIKGVLRIERFEASELPVRPKNVYPADLLDNLMSDYTFAARDKGLRLQVDVDRSARIFADPELLNDILGNLIDNAIKYTREGVIHISFKDKGDKVLFIVKDSGPGVKEERKDKIFEPVAPEASGGAGIGLAVVKRSVEAMKGRVDVESRPGKGSSFFVELPKTIKPQNLYNKEPFNQ